MVSTEKGRFLATLYDQYRLEKISSVQCRECSQIWPVRSREGSQLWSVKSRKGFRYSQERVQKIRIFSVQSKEPSQKQGRFMGVCQYQGERIHEKEERVPYIMISVQSHITTNNTKLRTEQTQTPGNHVPRRRKHLLMTGRIRLKPSVLYIHIYTKIRYN